MFTQRDPVVSYPRTGRDACICDLHCRSQPLDSVRGKRIDGDYKIGRKKACNSSYEGSGFKTTVCCHIGRENGDLNSLEGREKLGGTLCKMGGSMYAVRRLRSERIDCYGTVAKANDQNALRIRDACLP